MPLNASALATMMLVASVAISQNDWPSVRGQKFDGHSTEPGLVDGWPKEGPPLIHDS